MVIGITTPEHLHTHAFPAALTCESAERKMVTSLFRQNVAMGDECVKPGARLKLWLIFKELINYSAR